MAGSPFGWLARRWTGLWFAPTGPENLGLCRALFFGAFFLLYATGGLSTAEFAFVPQELWLPHASFRLLGLEPLSYVAMKVLEVVWLTSLAFACLGLWTRPSTLAALVLGFYLLGLPHSFGKVDHDDSLVVLLMAVLALSRCGDAWSLDSLRMAGRGVRSRVTERATVAGEYRWPVVLAWMVFGLIFFAAGVAKLRNGGLGWITSDTLKNTMLMHYYFGGADLMPFAGWLADLPLVPNLLAAATISIELLAILVAFHWRARVVLVPLLFLMQIGNWVLIGVGFLQYLICYLFFVPWDAVSDRIRCRRDARAGRDPGYHVLFDGDCGLCRATVRVLERMDVRRRVEFREIVAEWPEISRRFPGLDRAECLAEMHVMLPDGTARRGFRGYRALARALPLLWPILPLLHLPGASLVGQRVYERVAEGRAEDSCVTP